MRRICEPFERWVRRAKPVAAEVLPDDAYDVLRWQLDICDNQLDHWQVDLVNEYGFDRAMRAIRASRTPVDAAERLERERRTNERERWLLYEGRLPPGQ